MKKKRNRYRADKANRRKIRLYWCKTMGCIILGAAAVVLLSAALARAYYAILDAPWFRVEEIQINGLKHLEREAVVNALGVPRNASVLTLRMSELPGRLEALPWLRSAAVRLDTPGRIVVDVTERLPMAIVSADDLFLLDTEGHLFAKTTAEQNAGLLVLTGFSGSKLHEGESLPSETFQAVKDLLSALERAKGWLPATAIAEVNWSLDAGFLLRTAPGPIAVRLGSENLVQKLNRLQSIFRVMGERHWLDLVTRIDLDYSDRCYVEGNFPPSKGT